METNKVEVKFEIGKDIKALLDLRRKEGYALNDFIEKSVTYYHGKLLKDLEEKLTPVFMGRL